MNPLKVNIFISHAPEDKPAVETLLEWLYPMRDEVNLWHYDPPEKPEELPLSWRILLPWYRPADPRDLYSGSLKSRREHAHIYLFLTSFRSLKNKQVEDDISLAVGRRIDSRWEGLAPLVLPLLLSPSRWKAESRLARFEPLLGGIEVSKFPQPEDAYQLVAEQVAAFVKMLQMRLNEARHYKYQPETLQQAPVPTDHKPALQQSSDLPYLGENPEQFEFKHPVPFRPPDWMGWSLIALIFTLTAGSFRKSHPAVSSLHLKARPANEYEIEYRRPPLAPLPDSVAIVLPPVE